MASTSTPASPLPQIDLGPTLGAALIGLVFAAILHGITILQGILYYRMYSKDHIFLKLLVGLLLILDTLDLTLIVHGVYTYLITDFDNPAGLTTLVWSIATEPLVGGIVATIVHLFLAYRIKTLDHKWWPLSVVIGVTSMFTFAVTITVIVISETATSISTAYPKQRWTTYAGEITTVAIDLTIAASITYLLHRNRSGFAQTDRTINKIMLYVISNGLITSTLSVSVLIAYSISQTDLYFLMISFSTSKAYTNTLLATLTSRQYTSEPTLNSACAILQLKDAPQSMDSHGVRGVSSGSGSQDVIPLSPYRKVSPADKISDSTWPRPEVF